MIKIISVKTITKRLNESTNNIIPNTTVGGGASLFLVIILALKCDFAWKKMSSKMTM